MVVSYAYIWPQVSLQPNMRTKRMTQQDMTVGNVLQDFKESEKQENEQRTEVPRANNCTFGARNHYSVGQSSYQKDREEGPYFSNIVKQGWPTSLGGCVS